jgi:CheY-like chemotaxis protein
MKTQPFKVLVADDDPIICSVVSKILRCQGHTVEVAENGKEAIKLFALKPDYFNVLITDHDMPLVSGLELIDHLQKNGARVKIIVMSGSLTTELLGAYRDKRVDNILQKPFTLKNLSSALEAVLRQREGLVHA